VDPIRGQNAQSDFERLGAYAYYHWQPVNSLALIGGVAYDRITFPLNHRFAPVSGGEDTRDPVGPKAGLVWSPFGSTTVRAAYAKWGQWIILFQGLTPIPYKIVTIATGFAGFPFATFVLMSAITRGFRYFTEASLLYVFGNQIRGFIEKRFSLALWVSFAAVIFGFVLARYAF